MVGFLYVAQRFDVGVYCDPCDRQMELPLYSFKLIKKKAGTDPAFFYFFNSSGVST